jgi:Mg2+ and Co2+ transporter CorA
MQTNKVMKMLTIYASIMMPMGVIVGLYGMNVPVWPAPDTPNVFWTIVGFMLILGSTMISIFRYLKWL